MVSLIKDVKGSNLDDNEFILRCAMIGRSRFLSFHSVKTDNGSFPSEVDTFPIDSVEFVSLKRLTKCRT